jgi:hypothetical protein
MPKVRIRSFMPAKILFCYVNDDLYISFLFA